VQSGWFRLNYNPGGFAWRPGTVADHPDPTGRHFYLAGHAGIGWDPDRDLIGPTTGQLDAFDIGPAWFIAVGYRFGRHWLAEVEAARRINDMQIFDTLVDERRTTGEVTADSLMLNLRYRFRPESAVNPHLGLGGGIARREYDLDFASNGRPLVRKRATTWAVQALAGFDVALTRHWTFAVDYQVWVSGKVRIDPVGSPAAEVTHLVHSMGAGFRYELGG